MAISEQKKKIKVSELCQGYTDDGDGGVYSEKKKITLKVFRL